jgi:signal transduction histidine kinase
MRALIFELRPESLERDGLIAALERQVASVRARPAHGKTIQLQLRDASGQVVLTVADDGVGFNPLVTYGGHLGLVSMRERATAVGGSLSIDSTPGGGSRVTAEVHE